MGKQRRIEKKEAKSRRGVGYRMRVKGHISNHLIQVDISECAGTSNKDFATAFIPVETWDNTTELKRILENAITMRLTREPLVIVEQKK